MKKLVVMLLTFFGIATPLWAQDISYRLLVRDITPVALNILTFQVLLKCETGAQLLPSQVQTVININPEFKNGGQIEARIINCLDPSPQLDVDNYNNYLSLLANQFSNLNIRNGETQQIATIEIKTTAASFGNLFKWTWKNTGALHTKIYHYVNGHPEELTNSLWHLPIELLTGIVHEPGEVSDYSLSQNYPNPFNPTTTIKFQIKEEGFTSLIVFDITGKEVERLVNDELKPGNYKVGFNGSNLASGTYLYKLQSENFIEAKKMILTK